MARRAGRTVKVSISLERDLLEALRKRARRTSRGNLSAVIAEMIALAQEWEGRIALDAWLNEGRPEPTKAELDAVRAEWRGAVKRKRRRAA